MTRPFKAGAVLYVKYLERAQAFYEAVAALAVEHREDDHVVLASSAFELVLLRTPEPMAASITIAAPPERRSGTPIKLVFLVDSLVEARAAASLHGGALNPPAREWEFRGCRVCDGHDPEGNVVQFRQQVAQCGGPARRYISGTRHR